MASPRLFCDWSEGLTGRPIYTERKLDDLFDVAKNLSSTIEDFQQDNVRINLNSAKDSIDSNKTEHHSATSNSKAVVGLKAPTLPTKSRMPTARVKQLESEIRKINSELPQDLMDLIHQRFNSSIASKDGSRDNIQPEKRPFSCPMTRIV